VTALHGVWAEEDGARDDEDDELEDARERCAVNRCDSSHGSPSACKHKNRVNPNDHKCDPVQN